MHCIMSYMRFPSLTLSGYCQIWRHDVWWLCECWCERYRYEVIETRTKNRTDIFTNKQNKRNYSSSESSSDSDSSSGILGAWRVQTATSSYSNGQMGFPWILNEERYRLCTNGIPDTLAIEQRFPGLYELVASPSGTMNLSLGTPLQP